MNDDCIASIPCNLCQERSVTVLSNRSRSGAALRTVICRRCGLVWSDPRPHEARRFYEDEYRLVYKRTFEPRPKHVLRAGKTALSRLEKIESRLRSRMRILDVGSGGGEFAYLLRTLGHDVHGIEPNRGYAQYAAEQYGLRITRAFVDEVELLDRHYDLITVWHVLEHTENPFEVLRQLGRALAPGGTLVVEVPNVEARCQSPRSTFHEAHLYSFNAESLKSLAARAGLRTCQSTTSPDGGNITAFFRSAPAQLTAAPADFALPGNHDRIACIVRDHTPLSHWLSVHPFGRFARRFKRMVSEWWQTRRPTSDRVRLDGLYAHGLRAPAQPQAMPWHLIAGAYLIAVVQEWLLLDALVSRAAWIDAAALGAYLATQCAIVAGIVSVSERPRTTPQLVTLGGWSLPLFALPAFC